ncbi:hypothetical protein GCM10008939_01040 [Deinococcus aquiradiocola]|uniref:ABC-2 type transport system permease protein n=1 Tax=Deinococcus aquiradiocola TaxID=393059 RepID=A0A917P4E3_9DEIO|nr:hypothetical protein GCM10008939_01040 [Deinococcus aquiradiocola]
MRRGAWRPGSLPWLIVRQVRLDWRSRFASAGTRWMLGLGAVLILAVSVAVWPSRDALNGSPHLTGLPLLLVGVVGLGLGLLLFSASVTALLESLYERGDLDLLLGAPIPPGVVLASRLLGVAVSSVALVALLALPPVLVGVFVGVWRALGVLPWLMCVSLLSTALAALFTLGLVRLVGVRSARTVASVVGAVGGGGLYLLSQWQNMTGHSALETSLVGGVQAGLAGRGVLGEGSPVWIPARALWLEPGPAVMFVALTLLVFAGSVVLLQGAFRSGAQQATSHDRPAAGRGVQVLTFRPGRLALLFKEWRLLQRDPLLLSRTLLQLVYLLPLAFTLKRQVGAGIVTGSVGVLALGSLTAGLAHITANAEDAPELLMTAPQPAERLRRVKLLAAVLPVLLLWGALSALLLARSPGAQSLLGVLLSLLSVLGSAVIVLWWPMQVRRADLFRPGQRSDLRQSLSTVLLQGGLALANFALLHAPLWGALGLTAALTGPVLVYLRGRHLGR